MYYPNKTFVVDIECKTGFGNGKMKRVIVLVAKNEEIGAKYLNENYGTTIVPNNLIWLMGNVHPTIYDQKGDKPLKVQAKIMYNTTIIID